MTNAQRQKIIEGIIEEAKSSKKSPRIGWHVRNVLDSEAYSDISQIEAYFDSRKKYKVRRHGTRDGDFEVRINEDYYWGILKEFLIMPLVGALLALIVGYILWRIDDKSKNKELGILRDRIETLSHRLDSIEHTQH